MCGGVYAAIREQASDWSRPEAEEDAPRLTRERIFYDPLVHTHTHTSVHEISMWRSGCLAAAKIRLASQHAFVSQLFWLAHLLHLDTCLLLSRSLQPCLSLSLSISTTLSNLLKALSDIIREMWANLLWSDCSKRALPVPLAVCVHNSKVSAIFLLLYKLAEWHFQSIKHNVKRSFACYIFFGDGDLPPQAG